MDYKVRVRKIMLILMPILIIGLMYAVFIEITGLGLDCIIYENTGLKCPGCGVTRMCMNILHFNFKAAYANNQLLFVALPIAFMWLLYKMVIYIRTGKLSNSKLENICLYIFMIAIVVFTIVRNIDTI